MKVVANSRQEQGSSASRRLRRAGMVPGIVYGGPGAPASISVDHNSLYHSLRVEAFHSSILDLELNGGTERVLLRDVQWHPYKPLVMHVDFQRVAADRKIHVSVPLHFVGQENSPAVKLAAGLVGHVMTELDIECLPQDLPEFIEVDLSNLQASDTIHVSQLTLPPGVTFLGHGQDDPVIVTVSLPGGAHEEAEGEAEEPLGGGEEMPPA
ncbi:MAG: 50S ribosomal protein L25/general stress protein Ctc [Burkholderiales bacterium]|nr:MAG: 50S ribosomal protein L25/general stress protein Ctc [Burkholderiales bacterium]